MEISLRQTMKVIPILIGILLSLTAFSGWLITNKENWNSSINGMEKQQLDINKTLQGKSFPVIECKNMRVKIGKYYDPKTNIKVLDNQDGNISDQVQIYGSVDINTKGVYKLRVVAVNSYGLKSVKNIQVIVD